MSPPVGVTSRWAGLVKRFGLAAFLILVLVYLLPGQTPQDKWQSHPSQKPLEEMEKDNGLHMPTEADMVGTAPMPMSGFEIKIQEFQTPIANRDWGKMAIQVKQLSQWAQELVRTNIVDPRHMNDALLTRFPYLKGSKMYRPWGYRPEEDRQTLLKVGLVMCVGNQNFHLASHLIVNLRHVLNSTVPIEVAFAGDDDLFPKNRDYIKTLAEDITFIDLLKFFPKAKQDLERSGWAMKSFSLLASKHTHVMLVDADAIFFADPANLFGLHPDLKRTGTLMYHDRAAIAFGDDGLGFLKEQIIAAGNVTSKQLSQHSLYYAGNSWYEADSGLVALDKSRPDIFMSLVFITWLNTKSVREEVSYKLYHGDKETFWIAMELAGVEYYFQPSYAGSIGHVRPDPNADLKTDTSKTKLCSTHMLHMDHSGSVPFWFNGGIYEHKDAPQNGFAKIDHYWQGGPDINSMPEWTWEQGTIACIEEKNVKPVPDRMLGYLSLMYQNAAMVDDQIKQLMD